MARRASGRRAARPERAEERLWCTACRSQVIWAGDPGEPPRCLECRGTSVARGEPPDAEDEPPLDGPGLVRADRRFLDAVYELYRLEAAKQAKEGE